MRNLDMKGKEERAAARLQRESKAHVHGERRSSIFVFNYSLVVDLYNLDYKDYFFNESKKVNFAYI
jgi:hypothetical protein